MTSLSLKPNEPIVMVPLGVDGDPPPEEPQALGVERLRLGVVVLLNCDRDAHQDAGVVGDLPAPNPATAADRRTNEMNRVLADELAVHLSVARHARDR